MDFGGIERGVYDFSLKATELGHEVVVASGSGRFASLLKENGIKCHDLPMERKNPAVFFRSCRLLKKIIESEKPDILHAQSRFPCWIACYVMKSFPEMPWVTSIHNFHTARWYSQSVGKGNLVITVSKALKKYAMEYLRIPEDRIRVVYNGIDGAFLNIKKTNRETPTIGMIARLSAWKGHFFFLEAFKKVRGDGLNVNALIVGSGSEKYRMEIERWISENRMDETVKIIRMDAKEALGNMDVLVVPSLEPEGFGRTVVEAQMSKTPVIGTNIGAIPELIENGKTGFMIKPGNAGQLADKIRFILTNPDAASSITHAAFYNAVKNFTVSHMAEKTLGVYGELLK